MNSRLLTIYCLLALFPFPVLAEEEKVGNPAFDNADSLFYHARKGMLDEVREDLTTQPEQLTQLDIYKRTPLFYSAKSGRAEVTDLLLAQKGVRTDLLDSYGYSALHWPAMYGHVEVLKVFGKHGVDVDQPSKEGVTPLHEATGNGYSNAHNKHAEVVALLLKLGADVNAKDDSGRTPLIHSAGLPGKLPAMRVLLDTPGIQIDQADDNGSTALHNAAGLLNVEKVKLLLEKGADRTVEDEDGHTPAAQLRSMESLLTGREQAQKSYEAVLKLLEGE